MIALPRLALQLALTAALLVPVSAYGSDDFFSGKTITFSTFTPPGGSYDTYLRLLTRHVGKHIPGHPGTIVLNQPGAGGLLAVNYAGRIAPKDGTFATLVGVGLFMQEAVGLPGMKVSLRDFKWIGNFDTVTNVFATWPTSKARTIEDAVKAPVLMGSVGAGSIDAQLPAAVNALVGTKFKVVPGYAGSPAVILAMQRGEVEGKVNGWPSFKAEIPADQRSKLHLLLQMGLTRDPELPNVPLLIDLVRNDPGKEAVARFLSLSMVISRALAAPPGVPDEQVALLRRAFDATMADPDFLADARRTGFDINPMTGAKVQEAVEQIFATPKTVIARTKAILATPAR